MHSQTAAKALEAGVEEKVAEAPARTTDDHNPAAFFGKLHFLFRPNSDIANAIQALACHMATTGDDCLAPRANRDPGTSSDAAMAGNAPTPGTGGVESVPVPTEADPGQELSADEQLKRLEARASAEMAAHVAEVAAHQARVDQTREAAADLVRKISAAKAAAQAGKPAA